MQAGRRVAGGAPGCRLVVGGRARGEGMAHSLGAEPASHALFEEAILLQQPVAIAARQVLHHLVRVRARDRDRARVRVRG